MRGISWLAERTLSFLRRTLLPGVNLVYNNPPLESILSQFNAAHILIRYLFTVHFDITLQSKLAFNKHVSIHVYKKIKQEEQQLSLHSSRNTSWEPLKVWALFHKIPLGHRYKKKKLKVIRKSGRPRWSSG
jgi:hypothetical protein